MTQINKNYIDEIGKLFSDKSDLEFFLNSCRLPLKKSIKINKSKISVKKFKELTEPLGWKLIDPGFLSDTDTFYIDRDDTSTPLGKTFLHMSGFFYIQEIAASLPANLLEIKPDALVLDVSAAPGGKSVQLGDNMICQHPHNPGALISNDPSKARTSALAHNLNRMGIYNAGVSCANGISFGKDFEEMFDAVLVDAPCSGEGTGFKSDFAMQFWNIHEIKKIAGLQNQILTSAINATKTGGNIIFSTCTLNPIENELNVKKILDEYSDQIELWDVAVNGKSLGVTEFDGQELLSPEQAKKVARFWPHTHKTGGFFIAKFKKIKSTKQHTNRNEKKSEKKINYKIEFGKGFQKSVNSYLDETFGIDVDTDRHTFIATNDFVFAVSKKFLEIINLVRWEKFGIPVFRFSDGIFRPLHGLGTILGDKATKNIINLSYQNAQKYSELNDLNLSEIENCPEFKNGDYVILKRENMGIGVGKIIDGVVKNKYIKS